MNSTSRHEALLELARLCRVETSFHDFHGRLYEAREEALCAILRELGVDLDAPDWAEHALRERRAALATRRVEPVAVVWDDGGGAVEVSLPSGERARTAFLRLTLEDGGERREEVDLTRLEATPFDLGGGFAIDRLRVPLPEDLSLGYHGLEVVLDDDAPRHALVVAAPRLAYSPRGRFWGAFLPAYAVTSANGDGCGTLGTFAQLIEWVESHGGSLVGSTPLLATFLRDPFVPSPYAPASRLFWNELYVDPTDAPEFGGRASELFESDEFRRERADLRKEPWIEYRRTADTRRRLLEAMAEDVETRFPARLQAFRGYLAEHPRLVDYARFRARCEDVGCGWRGWPSTELPAGLDLDDPRVRYHAYAQWLAHEQLERVGAEAAKRGLGLYLDFPVGVHPDAYDVWAHRELFARGVASGAPPDALFSGGQDWDFPPLHPEAIRRDGYRYLRECVRQHLRYAGVLRIDHVMAFHRLYWIPRDFQPTEGVYVHYRPEELHAVFNLESHREKALLLGEDLGTVPDEVRASMREHGLLRMHVAQFAFRNDPEDALELPPEDSVTCLNTHDTPTFAGFWNEKDLDTFGEIECLPPDEIERQRQGRAGTREALPRYLEKRGVLDPDAPPSEREIAHALHLTLARSEARVVMLNLEDVWGETRPQNVPGTGFERPNWQRRATLTIEGIAADDDVAERLDEIDRERRSDRDPS